VFISQKQAKLKLRHEAGLPVLTARAEVKKLPKYRYGKREKVKLADVQQIIDEAAQPTPVISLPEDSRRRRNIERIKKRLNRST
jgi:hypothetical protein